MNALHGRRNGPGQLRKTEPSALADASATAEPEDSASAQALAAQDRSGWPPHPSERRDFYHRICVFPPEMAAWRKRMLRKLAGDAVRFPLASSASPEENQTRLDDGISYLREAARILAVLYGTPDLGNKPDPTDEKNGDWLRVFEVPVPILADGRTGLHHPRRQNARRRLSAGLKNGDWLRVFEVPVPVLLGFRTWDDLLDAPRRTVAKLVYSGGLSGKKTTALRAALRKLRETFGRCTLKPARAWSDEKLEEFLCSLPEIERKSAYCIMMDSLGRQIFPADTHVGRVLSRLGP